MIQTFRQVISLLTPGERRRTVLLFFLMLLGMALETFSLGIVLPVFDFLSQDNYLEKYPWAQTVVEWLGNPSRPVLVGGVMLLLTLAYLVKNGFLVLLLRYQMAFIFSVQARLSQRLFQLYLSQPYTFHLQRNSAQMVMNAFTQIGTVVQGGLQPGLFLLTEGLVLIGVSALLLRVEPVGTLLILGVLIMVGIIYYMVFKHRLAVWGKSRHYHEGMRVQHLQQGLGGVKDIILLGREAEFLGQYESHNFGSADLSKKQSIMQQVPRLLIESMAIAALSILVVVMVLRGQGIDSIVPVMSVFAAAAFRLMPSFNRIINSLQGLRSAYPVIGQLHEELQEYEANMLLKSASQKGQQKYRNVLSVSNVGFSYSKELGSVVKDLSFEIRKGESVGIIGGSGAGKTTLVDIILGLLEPTEGAIEIDGMSIRDCLRSWQDQIGYVPQDIFLTDDTLRRNIAFGLPDDAIDDMAVQEAVKAAQLEDLVDRLPDGLETKVGERGVRVSGGQRQRVGIARALYHKPEVLFLDEATSALDVDTEKEVMKSIEGLQGFKTVIIIAHRLSTVAYCDKLIKLKDGKIEHIGSYDEVVR